MNIKRLLILTGTVILGLTLVSMWSLLLSGPPELAHAAGSWYVALGGSDSNSCLSTSTPCATINGAIGKANPSDTIYVAVGMYTGTGDEVVLIDKDMNLSGGWDTSFTSQSDNSTIDGQGSRRGVTVNNGVTAIIKRFSIQGGHIGESGGGIYNGLDSNLTVANVTVVNNSGDGICNDGGTLRVMNSTISNNYGDGVTSFHPSESRSVTMTGSTVENNSESGIRGINTELTVSHSSISGNQDRGVWNSGDLIFKDVSITGNNRGGISAINNSLTTLVGVTISGNFTSGEGGGIYYWGSTGGTATMTNVTISGNTAVESGGGIMAASGTHSNMAFINVTITNNTAASGGGIYNESITTFTNSIVADNTGENCDGGNNVTSNGHNLDSGNTCGFSSTGDKSNTSPLLGPLADNGGPTLTHALLDGSSAIDAGNPASCPDTDQRGLFRVDGDNNGSIICDIGAFEFDDLEPKESSLPIVLKNYGH